MGGLYVSDDVLDYSQTYCEECGDSDTLIGWAESREDAFELLEDSIDMIYTGEEACKKCGCTEKRYCKNCDKTYSTGGLDFGYVMKFVYGHFEWKDEQRKDIIGIMVLKKRGVDEFFVFDKNIIDDYGKANRFTHMPLISEIFENRVAGLLPYSEDSGMTPLQKIGEHIIGDAKYLIYYCEEKNPDMNGCRYVLSSDNSCSFYRLKDIAVSTDKELLQCILDDIEKRNTLLNDIGERNTQQNG